MLFKEPHVRLILEGKKTATRRVNGRYKLGSTQAVQTQFFERSRARIRILRRYRQRLGAMTESDARKEGGYTLREFAQVWRQIHGSWDPELEVWVYEFTLANRKTSEGVTHAVPFAQPYMASYYPAIYALLNLWHNRGHCVLCGSGKVWPHFGLTELAFYECSECEAVYNTAGDLTHPLPKEAGV